jgi:hypothetical protein
MNETKTVALVASLWMGHHPMYFKVFVSALADLGIRVLPFCPVPEDELDWRNQSVPLFLAQNIVRLQIIGRPQAEIEEAIRNAREAGSNQGVKEPH